MLGLTLVLTVGVRADDASDSRLSFPTRILPLLTQAGCNAGACHGAATGQGGFALSLLGYDPEADHARITRELGGRRLDFEEPEASLFLLKPARQVAHEGGRRLPADSEAYRLVRDWVKAGAPYGPRDLRVSALVVGPEEGWLPGPNGSFDLRVTARLSDGTRVEVTDRALLSSNDDGVATVTRNGRVTAVGSGLTSVMVRYGGQVAAARVGVRFEEGENAAERRAAFATGHPVDEHIAATWERLGLAPSPPSDDAEFLRRVHLDLVGRLPTSEAARAFLKKPASSERRAALVDALLGSEDWVDFWTLKLADLLQVSGRRGGPEAARAYHGWLRDRLRDGMAWDRTVRDTMLAEGPLTEVGPANFFTLASDPRDLAEHAGRIFLGTQIACARCHAHPTDRWTMADYHGFAAFFARTEVFGGEVRDRSRGEVDDPGSGRPVVPKALDRWEAEGEAEGEADEVGFRRRALADWMTAPDNPFLARAFVNRVWQHLFGRGLVEPVDDLRPTNPATHPALLDALAAEFVAEGHDLRKLIRRLVTSRTYGLSSVGDERNRTEDRFYTRAYRKALPAAVFVDAVAQVTGVPERYDGYPEGTRAVQLIDAQAPSFSLDVLGRCGRQDPCGEGGSGSGSGGGGGGGLAQALHLLNGTLVNARLNDATRRSWSEAESAEAWIEEFYLRAYSRYPSSAERARWTTFLEDAPEPVEAAEDLIWALLNSREFAFNR